MFKTFCAVLIVIVSVSCVLSQKLSQIHKDLLKRSVDECMQASMVDREILNRARNLDYVEDHRLMDYYVCMFRADHLAFLDSAGEISTESMRTFLHLDGDTALWNDIIAHCFERASNGDIAMSVYRSIVCFTDKVGKLNIYS